ncbi:MAG: GNAT family N-acetyltransferase [Chloroflexi bacterium]|nr:GNAT family N-acetyltransferase [Chloroflexota bacterium]MCA2001909.1 GNAT family N-acetyltransferase [Chloroflexota bacterium]
MKQTSIPLPSTTLREDLKLRLTRWTDADAVAKLIYEVCEADGDVTVATTAEELKNAWKNEGFDIERDAFVVETQDGRIVGYEDFFHPQGIYHDFQADGYVHPQFKGLGVGRAMLQAVESRAREEMKLAAPDLRVFIRNTIDNKDRAGHDLFKSEGYFPVRYHWRMEVKLTAPPAPAAFPEGVELRPFIKDEHAVAVWRADNEAFRDHWGSRESSYEVWSHRKFGRSDFDPSLWMVAWDGEQVAGFSQNRFRMGIGWIGSLGVRRPWRRRGLGLALLLHSFGEFYKRGATVIGLGVDSANPSGATRLYQRAGMYVASEFATYEKELRPGRSAED